MTRRVRACAAASRRGAGEDKGRAATRPGKGEMAALQSASLIPGRLVVGRRPLQVRRPTFES